MPDAAWVPKLPSSQWDLSGKVEPKLRELAAYHRAHGDRKSYDEAVRAYLDDDYGRPPRTFVFDGESITPETFRDRYTVLGDPNVTAEEVVINRNVLEAGAEAVHRVQNFEEAEARAIEWLDHGKPVGLSYTLHDAELDAAQSLWSLRQAQTTPTDAHAVVLVGYIKDFDGKRPIAWKALNSWGTDDAGRGFFVLSRDFVKARFESFSLFSRKP